MKAKLVFSIAVLVLAGALSTRADLLFYEPFDYPDGVLNDQPAGPLGSAGVWISLDTGFKPAPYTALGTWWVHPEGAVTGQGDDAARNPNGVDQLNLFDGTVANLAHKGGFAGAAGPEDKDPPVAFGTRSPTGNMDASISLDPSVTATFQAGTTTWFSYVASHADNRNQGSPQFLLCTDPIVNGDRGYRMQTTNGGFGIGGVGGQTRANLFDVYPQWYGDGVKNQTPGGYEGGVLGAHNGRVTSVGSGGTSNATLPNEFVMPWAVRDADGFMGVPNIVVGKIEWDAPDQATTLGGFYDVITVVSFQETDELTEAAFDALVALKPELSSRNWPAAGTPFDAGNPSNKPDLDQSQFNLISLSSLKFWIDEIRVATTFADVTPGPAPLPKFRLAIASDGAGGYDLDWDSTSSMYYEVRSSTDLSGKIPTWNLVQGDIAPSGTGVTTFNVTPTEPVLFYGVVAIAPPPVTLFSEDFDTTTAGLLPGGWDTSTNPGFEASLTAWELGTPSVVGPVPPGVPLPSGTQCVGTNLAADYDDPPADDGLEFTDIWLRSAPIDLSGRTEATLTFQQWTEIEDIGFDLDYGSIRILDAVDDSELAVLEDRSIDGSTSGWEEYSKALPAAAFTSSTGSVRIEWRFEADDIDSFAGWYIDSVTVTAPGP